MGKQPQSGKRLLRRAIAMNVVCLAVASSMLLIGTNVAGVPPWVLAAGAAVSFVCLVLSITFLVKARRAENGDER